MFIIKDNSSKNIGDKANAHQLEEWEEKYDTLIPLNTKAIQKNNQLFF